VGRSARAACNQLGPGNPNSAQHGPAKSRDVMFKGQFNTCETIRARRLKVHTMNRLLTAKTAYTQLTSLAQAQLVKDQAQAGSKSCWCGPRRLCS
jgi:hypothetical protein